MSKEEQYNEIFSQLEKSKFRTSFYLKKLEKDYAKEKGYLKIREHAYDFIGKRLALEKIENDGKQTPMKRSSGVCCSACNCDLLQRVFRKMA